MPCALDQATLDRLAEIARIPPSGRQRFAESVHKLVRGALKTADWWQTRRSTKPDGRQASAALAKVEKAARRLAEALNALEPDERAMLQLWLPYGASPRMEAVAQTAEMLAEAGQKAVLYSKLATENEPRRKVGRPPKQPGAGTLPGAELFVLMMYAEIEGVCGGHLTFTYANKSGTLLDLLDVLKPYLPNGHVPSPDRLRILRPMGRAMLGAFGATSVGGRN